METVFDAIAGAHSNLARQRVLADVRALGRDARDLLTATVGDLRESGRRANLRLPSETALRKYGWIGAALVLGVLAGALIARSSTPALARK